MAYGNIAARHRLGLSARAYNALYQWARDHAPAFSGRHEEMTWSLLRGVTMAALLQQRGCGHAAIDEIAAAMKQAGHTMADHAASLDQPPALARGSRVQLAGRSRTMVVVDYAAMGEEVIVRLRAEEAPLDLPASTEAVAFGCG